MRQDIFNKVVLHFVEQGSLAYGKTESSGPTAYDRCAYRTFDGKRCAIGALIPDEIYTRDIEGSTVDGIMMSSEERFAPVAKFLLALAEGNTRFLGDVQTAHDRAGVMSSLYDNLLSVGKDYSLDTSILEQNKQKLEITR